LPQSATRDKLLTEFGHSSRSGKSIKAIGAARRNYLDHAKGQVPGSEVWPDFDVVTELWFDSTSELEAFVTRMRDGEEGRRLRRDSSRFLREGTTRMFEVDETVAMREADRIPCSRD
jgi:hypothetical protein